MKEEILETGTYDLTYEELQYGCNLAWRNEPRCPARVQWENLVSELFWNIIKRQTYYNCIDLYNVRRTEQ